MMIAAAAISVESQFSYDKALKELTISQKIAPYPKIFGLLCIKRIFRLKMHGMSFNSVKKISKLTQRPTKVPATFSAAAE